MFIQTFMQMFTAASFLITKHLEKYTMKHVATQIVAKNIMISDIHQLEKPLTI